MSGNADVHSYTCLFGVSVRSVEGFHTGVLGLVLPRCFLTFFSAHSVLLSCGAHRLFWAWSPFVSSSIDQMVVDQSCDLTAVTGRKNEKQNTKIVHNANARKRRKRRMDKENKNRERTQKPKTTQSGCSPENRKTKKDREGTLELKQ